MASAQNLSFIVHLDISADSRWLYSSESTSDLIGYEASELRGLSFFQLVHPEEQLDARNLFARTIQQDKAAVVVMLRLRHRSGAFVFCAFSRAVVCDRLIGSISLAGPPQRAMFRGVTAQEVVVLSRTPEAMSLNFRRWNDPPQSPTQQQQSIAATRMSPRTCITLTRFAESSTIEDVSNELILNRHACGRSLFNFVVPADYQRVNECIIALKHWGANEGGMLSDGGFMYLTFGMTPSGLHNNVPPYTPGDILVDAILWATSDGVLVVLRRSM